ncbi:hypothetical protein GPECTOR_691g831 [Gonium pectorale]|uniref:Protein kinase domain-containing protein n=1 Tax=Gonium pectorale TaxID=33097 RepID=A0A150FU84_GONPE|nr:hypothetical protein GPECTOR_691g831 [Gonium pectorale]|eukprot:KXZ41174.1 hypothetical protein GPECTOR_691g831 [Gonium pectorale]
MCQVVQTYIARGARLTSEYVDRIYSEPPAAPPCRRPARDFLPDLKSDDGMGAPRMVRHERQGWREVLVRVGAVGGKCLVMLVQEYCGAGNLHRAIQQGIFSAKPGHWNERVARRVLLRTAAEIVRGMIHLHSADVLHGDLKPANVLLGRSKKDRRGFEAKVADFGMSHLLGNTSKVESANWGTAAYTSPESFQGIHGKPSDVYSFGMLLWEMLTGRRPYPKLNAVQIMMGISRNGMRPEWPDAEWPELCALGRRCLAAEPRERPTFRELEVQLVELEEWLRDDGLREMVEAEARAAAATAEAAAGPSQQHDAPESGGKSSAGGSGGAGGDSGTAVAAAADAAVTAAAAAKDTSCNGPTTALDARDAPAASVPDHAAVFSPFSTGASFIGAPGGGIVSAAGPDNNVAAGTPAAPEPGARPGWPAAGASAAAGQSAGSGGGVPGGRDPRANTGMAAAAMDAGASPGGAADASAALAACYYASVAETSPRGINVGMGGAVGDSSSEG